MDRIPELGYGLVLGPAFLQIIHGDVGEASRCMECAKVFEQQDCGMTVIMMVTDWMVTDWMVTRLF
jgi:hypothetical protein